MEKKKWKGSICCDYSRMIMDGAFTLGANQNELNLLHEVFDQHLYSEFDKLHPYWEGGVEGEEINIDRLLNKIKDLAEAYTTKGLREYFLAEVWRDMQRLNKDNYPIEMASFNMRFEQAGLKGGALWGLLTAYSLGVNYFDDLAPFEKRMLVYTDNHFQNIVLPQANENQIISGAMAMYKNQPKSKFREYLEEQMDDAAKAMQDMIIEANRPGAFLRVVAETYFWNRERLKVLNVFSDLSNMEEPVQKAEPETMIWALFYWYLHRAGEMPELNDDSRKKKASLIALGKKHGRHPQRFYQTFNAVGANSEYNPLKEDVLEKVIPKLQGHSKAKEMAEKDLEEQKKKSNAKK